MHLVLRTFLVFAASTVGAALSSAQNPFEVPNSGTMPARQGSPSGAPPVVVRPFQGPPNGMIRQGSMVGNAKPGVVQPAVIKWLDKQSGETRQQPVDVLHTGEVAIKEPLAIDRADFVPSAANAAISNAERVQTIAARIEWSMTPGHTFSRFAVIASPTEAFFVGGSAVTGFGDPGAVKPATPAPVTPALTKPAAVKPTAPELLKPEPIRQESIAAVAPDLEIALPGPVTDLAVGGDGRYLVMAIASLRKVALFDVRAAKVVGYVDVDSERFFVAAGATRFVVLDCEHRQLIRFNLTTRNEEQRAPVNLKNPNGELAIVMSGSTEGPLWVAESMTRPQFEKITPLRVFDLEKLTPLAGIESTDLRLRINDHIRADFRGMTISAAGDVLAMPETSGSSPNTATFEFRDGRIVLRPTDETYSHHSALLPDGSFAKAKDSKGESKRSSGAHSAVIATSLANSWMTVDYAASVGADRDKPSPLTLGFHRQFQVDPFVIVRLKDLAGSAARASRAHVDHVALSRRLHYLPTEKTIAYVGQKPDAVLLKRFDLTAATKAAPFTDVSIDSDPPQTFVPGKPLTYQLEARAVRQPVTYTLAEGPSDMKISPTGLLEWLPTSEAPQKVPCLIRAAGGDGKAVDQVMNLTRMYLKASAVDPADLASKPAGSAAATDPGRATKTIALPSSAKDVCVGGNGRYLVANLPALRKCVVVDLKQRKLLYYVPSDDSNILLAAGATKFVVLHGTAKKLIRYDLAEGREESSVELTDPATPRLLLLGSNSHGPLYVSYGEVDRHTEEFRNLGDLTPLTLRPKKSGVIQPLGPNAVVSADGGMFLIWDRHGRIEQSVSIVGNTADYMAVDFSKSVSGRKFLLNDNGTGFYTEGSYRKLENLGNEMHKIDSHRTHRVPAVGAPLFATFPIVSDENGSVVKGSLSVFLQDGGEPLLTLANVELPALRNEHPYDDLDPLSPEQRCLLVPAADALVTLPAQGDRLIVQDFRIDEELAKGSTDVFYIASTPPKSVAAGATYRYQLAVKSKSGKVEARLEFGPPGMTLGPDAVLTWAPPADAQGDWPVVLAVADRSGKKTIQAFSVSIEGGSKSDVVALTTAVASAPRQTTEVDFGARISQVAVGGGGRYMAAYLKTLKKIAVVDIKERKKVYELAIDDDIVHIAAGATKLIVWLGTKQVFDRYSLADGKPEKSVPYSDSKVSMLVLGCASEGPLFVGSMEHSDTKYRFLELNDFRDALILFTNDEFSRRFRTTVNASADGRLFGGTGPNSPSGVHLLSIVNGVGKYFYHHESSGLIMPAADGTRAYSSVGAYSSDGDLLPHEKLSNGGYRTMSVIPATSGNYYLRRVKIDPDNRDDESVRTFLHAAGDSKPLLALMGFEPRPVVKIGRSSSDAYFSYERRWTFAPASDAVVEIPTSTDRLIIHRLVVDEELARADLDYLFVASKPPQVVGAATDFAYQIDAKSKRGVQGYRMLSGPQDMAVSSSGLVTWRPSVPRPLPQSAAVEVTDVIGQTFVHHFSLTVVPAKAAANAASTEKDPAADKNIVRTWTARDGTFKVEATLVVLDLAKVSVTLRRADGQTVDVPLAKLIEADENFVIAVVKSNPQLLKTR